MKTLEEKYQHVYQSIQESISSIQFYNSSLAKANTLKDELEARRDMIEIEKQRIALDGTQNEQRIVHELDTARCQSPDSFQMVPTVKTLGRWIEQHQADYEEDAKRIDEIILAGRKYINATRTMLKFFKRCFNEIAEELLDIHQTDQDIEKFNHLREMHKRINQLIDTHLS